jgi:hypothetical protein
MVSQQKPGSTPAKVSPPGFIALSGSSHAHVPGGAMDTSKCRQRPPARWVSDLRIFIDGADCSVAEPCHHAARDRPTCSKQEDERVRFLELRVRVRAHGRLRGNLRAPRTHRRPHRSCDRGRRKLAARRTVVVHARLSARRLHHELLRTNPADVSARVRRADAVGNPNEGVQETVHGDVYDRARKARWPGTARVLPAPGRLSRLGAQCGSRVRDRDRDRMPRCDGSTSHGERTTLRSA